jgi:hypothetical protein
VGLAHGQLRREIIRWMHTCMHTHTELSTKSLYWDTDGEKPLKTEPQLKSDLILKSYKIQIMSKIYIKGNIFKSRVKIKSQ